MTCEMCGSDIDTRECIVEGTILDLCSKCSSYGNIIKMEKPDLVPVNKPRKIVVEEPLQILVDNCGELIKKAREKKEMKQAELGMFTGEKESVINKYERGLLKPSLQTALKLQKKLGVVLIEDYETQNQVQFNINDKDITIGDLLKFKKKK